MPPKTNPEKTTKTSGKNISNAEIINIMEDAPLFAGLDDYNLSQAMRKKAETTKAAKVQEKKKPAAKKVKPKAAEKTAPKRAPKPRKSQPLDPNAILLSVTEMCTLLKISRATLVRMDKSGKLPGRIKMGGSVRFHRETVESWLQSLIAAPTVAEESNPAP